MTAVLPIAEKEFPDELSYRMLLSFHSPGPLAPDRIRSFLSRLQREKEPGRFSGFPENLYLASDALAQGGVSLQLTFHSSPGVRRDVRLQSLPAEGGYTIVMDLGSPIDLHDSLTSPSIIDSLSAGGHILGAQHAMLSLEPSVNSIVRLHVINGAVACNAPPILLWVSPSLADANASIDGMSLLTDEPDGSALFIARKQALTGHRPPTAVTRETEDGQRRVLATVLKHRLAAPDWRIRFNAVILAARASLQELAWAIQHVEVPSTGVPNSLRHRLLTIRRAALILLGDGPVPPLESECPDSREGMQAHLLRAVRGLPLAFQDEFSGLIASLASCATGEEDHDRP